MPTLEPKDKVKPDEKPKPPVPRSVPPTKKDQSKPAVQFLVSDEPEAKPEPEPEPEPAPEKAQEDEPNKPPDEIPKTHHHHSHPRRPSLQETIPIVRKEITFTGIKGAFTRFWSNVPLTIWIIFVNALYIPAYRWEWRRYRNWTYEVNGKGKSGDIEKKPGVRRMSRGRRISLSLTEAERHRGCRRIRINVSGTIFETQLRTLDRYPDTLIGKLRLNDRGICLVFC